MTAFRLARAYVTGELAAREDRVLFNVEFGTTFPAPLERVPKSAGSAGVRPGKSDRQPIDKPCPTRYVS